MSKSTSFKAKKSLGQNFLIDQNIIEKIIKACQLKSTDVVLEIGPGKGALTEQLSQHCKKVIAIEKDAHLAQKLKYRFEGTNVDVIESDILKYSLSKLPGNIKVIGNLPYNIATPIIKMIIDHRKQCSTFFMTVQLEYGQRMCAQPNTANYGSFSCFIQFYTDIHMLFKIGSLAFRPAPKVKSCFLKMKIRTAPRYKVNNEKLLFEIIRNCFSQRRKTIQNSLAKTIPKEEIANLLNTLGIDSKRRAENLSLGDYVRLTNAATSLKE